MCFVEELQTYFEQFGKVVEVVLKTDHVTGKPRGFGFVGFADPGSVDKVDDYVDCWVLY